MCVCIRRGPVSPEEGIVLPCPEPKPVDGRENCCQLLQAGGDEGVVEDTQSRGGRDGPWVGEVVYGVAWGGRQRGVPGETVLPFAIGPRR